MSKWKYDIDFYDIRNKTENVRDMVDYDINRIMAMFKWENLPITIPQRSLEMYLMFNGFVLLTKHNDDYCIYYGGLGGEPDYLYRPTIATIANPYQKWDAQLHIIWEVNEDSPENGVIIGLNDPMMKGLIPLLKKYNSLISENELTLWLTDILTRAPWLLSADNDKDNAAANEFIKNIFDGKMSSVQNSPFLEGIKNFALNNSNHQSLGALMQLHQYYKASKFNDLGLNAMQNQFKKEAISDSEQQMNTDTLTPFIDIMLECRKEFCEKVNEFYGLDISVELASAWKDNEIENEAMLEAMEEPEEEIEEPQEEQQEETEQEEQQETETEETETQLEEVVEELEEVVEELKDEVSEDEQSDNTDNQ